MSEKCIIGKTFLEKHKKYQKYYNKNSFYWGIGIENELYLEFEEKMQVDRDFFMKNHKRERYSVDYFLNYKKHYFMEALEKYIHNEKNFIQLPILLKSHSFVKTDTENQAVTNYTKECEPNPLFNGKLLIEYLYEKNEYVRNTFLKEWLFDGDTIEFTTLNFYNAKLQDVVEELNTSKNNFIKNINVAFNDLTYFKKYGSLKFMEKNHPFALYMTNLNNISIFNNGTLHYNITLPTELNEYARVKYPEQFKREHQKAIKIIQWFEPFIIAIFGTPDPFSTIQFDKHNQFSKSSQRCAVSKYIGIGTYNADKLESGKILSVSIEELDCSKTDYWWYNEYYKDNAYVKLNELGMDINFNKHFNHGIEIRFLEYIADNKKLIESFEFIIYLMDVILESDEINNFENPILNKNWNNIVLNTFKYGKDYVLEKDEIELYEKIVNIKFKSEKIADIYEEIYWNLFLRYNLCNLPDENEPEFYDFYPNGKYSSLTLDKKYLNIKPIEKHYIENIENDIFKDTAPSILIQEKNCCTIL
jgi:hypothetical protein